MIDVGEHRIDLFLGVFGRPCRASVLVAYVDDIPVFGMLTGPLDAASRAGSSVMAE